MNQKDVLLTCREKEVLDLLLLGYENPKIADILCITVHTVKVHISSLIKKLNARNRTNIIIQAIKSGVISI